MKQSNFFLRSVAWAKDSLTPRGSGEIRVNSYKPSCEGEANGPYFHSDRSMLRYFYSGYNDGPEDSLHLVYADLLRLHSPDTNPINIPNRPQTNTNDMDFELSAGSWPRDAQFDKHKEVAIEKFMKHKRIRILNNGEPENNVAVRLNSISQNNTLFKVSPTRYFDQIATNITLDWKSPVGFNGIQGTIRKDIEKHPENMLPSLEDSKLANSIGVAVALFYDKDKLFIRRRAGKNVASINEGELHCSASGVLELEEGDLPSNYSLSGLVERGMRAEIWSELRLRPEEYRLYPVAFARELPRGGKPQFFFAAVTDLSAEKLKDNALRAEEAWEFDADPKIEVVRPEELSEYTYEGRAVFQLGLMFRDANPSLFS